MLGLLNDTVTNCKATGRVSSGVASSGLGGLVGFVMMAGTIKCCCAGGDITTGEHSQQVGGLVGYFGGQSMSDCYARGNIAGGKMTAPAGGLLGSTSQMNGTIANCYATGTVLCEGAGGRVGGLIGEIAHQDFTALRNCFWSAESSGVSTSAGGTNVTAVQMRDAKTYRAAGWDFADDRADGTADIWRMSADGYPELAVLSASYKSPRLAGAGTPENPYRIASADDLSAVSQHQTACFKLIDDIDLAGVVWTTAPVPELKGNFDGNGHRIKHLTIRSSGPGDLGLFGHIDGQVRNLRLEDVSITAADDSRGVGGLAGGNRGSILNCCVTGSISAGTKAFSVGGLAADSATGLISNCYAAVQVSCGNASTQIGGLVGYSYMTTITNCYATGRVSGGDGSKEVGGIVGWGNGSTTLCFWDAETSGLRASNGGTGLTTAQMQDPQTYLKAGWDLAGERGNGLSETWQATQGAYPELAIFSNDNRPRELPGKGTPDDPYRITTAEDLGAIDHYSPLASYRLCANIDLSATTWTRAPILTFNGIFDGSGFTISHLRIRGGSHLGLFGILGEQAKVKNLSIQEVNIVAEEGARYTGSLAGASRGEIVGCHVTGRVTASRKCLAVGGLVGDMAGGKAVNCSAACNVSVGPQTGRVGGITGMSMSGKIIGCCATGSIAGSDDNRGLGGLAGEVHFWSTVSDCYATAAVSCGKRCSQIGGLIGVVSEGDVFPTQGKIVNCYATGKVTVAEGSTHVGGLLGTEAKIQPLTKDCYFLATSAQDGPSNAFGTVLSDEQMKQQANFGGWDFDSTWVIAEGKSYPRLRWEQTRPQP